MRRSEGRASIRRVRPPVACLALLAALAGCSDPCVGSAPAGAGPQAQVPVPDFGLLDVNPTSATSGETVSPRDRIGRTSAWYFGAAT